MELVKSLISELLNNTLNREKPKLDRKQFITKQIKLYGIKIKLLAFLGRKEGNFIIVDSIEGIELTIKKHSSKKIYLCELGSDLDNIKWHEKNIS
jgi:hypothetical protein